MVLKLKQTWANKIPQWGKHNVPNLPEFDPQDPNSGKKN